MMEALGTWLLSVSVTALAVSVLQTLIPEGGLRRVATFTGGLLLLAVLLRPVLGADLDVLDASLEDWTAQVEQRQAELEQAQTDALAEGIEERTAAYISDKAAALGLTVTVRVETETGEDGVPIPSAVEITGPRSAALEAYIAGELGIPADFYKTKDIHIHFPEGAVPKDGPSAGIAITTALCSALTGRKIRAKLAMTGEVTLRGRVLPIGGLKEKTMAALRYGVETVLIPQDNVRDLEDIDQTVRKALHFIPVRTVDEVLTATLCPREETAEEPAEAAFAPVAEPVRPALRQ